MSPSLLILSLLCLLFPFSLAWDASLLLEVPVYVKEGANKLRIGFGNNCGYVFRVKW